ncbi:MAG: hypothetical protein MR710_05095 [Bacteroidales bacterium]|nr:hypothetical protein [Bacteroidales bacterium]
MAKTPFSFVLVPDFVNRRMDGSVSRKVNSVSRMEVSVRHLRELGLSSGQSVVGEEKTCSIVRISKLPQKRVKLPFFMDAKVLLFFGFSEPKEKNFHKNG